MIRSEYSDTIDTISVAIERVRKGGKCRKEQMLELCETYAMALRCEIHNVLAPMKTRESEEAIRNRIRTCLLDKDKDGDAMRFAYNTMKELEKRGNNVELWKRCRDLYGNLMSLAAFRSFKHFCIYMQGEFGEGFTLWTDLANKAFSGYMHYANEMVLNSEINFMEKQFPTGYGKTMGDCFMHAYILGVNPNSDILKVCGNDKFTDDCFNTVVRLMLSPRYAKVFPEYKQFEGDKAKMFKYCTTGKELKFALNNSVKSTNLRVITKLSNTNGVRAEWLFIDDITQRADMYNTNAHEKDIHAFTHEWFERNYSRSKFKVVASGTTYSKYDILSYLKEQNNADKAEVTKINGFTSLSISNFICDNKIACFVCIPICDENGHSTYPRKISDMSIALKKKNFYEEFMAMDMQQPLAPTESPFYFTKLRQYDTLPPIGVNGRLPYCYAALDTKRRGKDNLSMPICAIMNDVDKGGECYPLVDWLYEGERSMEECLPLIVSKIIQHNVTRLYVERNTEECIEKLISDELHKANYYGCTIEEVYSTTNKETRIVQNEGYVKNKIIFPNYQMYAKSSDVGKALECVYTYSYNHKNTHDDAPDSLALFSDNFIRAGWTNYGTISSFNR